MKFLQLTVVVAILAASARMATAQDGATAAQPPTNQGQAANISPGQAAIDYAAAANRYVFVFFWKDKGQQTDNAWRVFQPAAATFAGSADVVSVQITNSAEKKLVERYGLNRAPMPLVLAIAPCGAITKAFTKTFDEKQLRTAFVSPCTQLCLKALQNRKLVFVCVAERTAPKAPLMVPKGVEDFKADQKFGPATEIVLVDAQDKNEAAFLEEIEVGMNAVKPVTVFLAPPGAKIGTFGGEATKTQLAAKLVAAQSNPCAGGKCGPGGCGPKKN